MDQISYDDFAKIDIRVGRIVAVDEFPQARKPAYKLRIDFGPVIGVKNSSAQITKYYDPNDLVGKLVLGVVNFPPRQIATFFSEVLTLGSSSAKGTSVSSTLTGTFRLVLRFDKPALEAALPLREESADAIAGQQSQQTPANAIAKDRHSAIAVGIAGR